MKLTKKQQQFIKDAYNSNDVCSEWKTKIKHIFPKVFKETELEVGKWYWRDGELMVWNDGKNTYGFNDDGLWGSGFCFSTKHDLKPATKEEVEQALIAEAKKRGFKDGVCFKTAVNGYISTFKGQPCFHGSMGFNLYGSDYEGCVFIDGKWATIVETISKEQAEKELGKKIVG